MHTVLTASIALHIFFSFIMLIHATRILTALSTLPELIRGGFRRTVCWLGRLSRGMATLGPKPLLLSIDGKHLEKWEDNGAHMKTDT